MSNKKTDHADSINTDQLDELFDRKNELEDRVQRLKNPQNRGNDGYRDELLRNQHISYLEKKIATTKELFDLGIAETHYPPLNTYHSSGWFTGIDFSKLKFHEAADELFDQDIAKIHGPPLNTYHSSGWFTGIDFSKLKFHEPPYTTFYTPHQAEVETERYAEKFNRILSDISESKIILPSENVTSSEALSTHVDSPTNRKPVTQITSGERRPGDLKVIVDNANNSVMVSSQAGNDKMTKFKRSDIVGKGTVTWDLLVVFAKCKGSLEGNRAADVKKLNTSVNRKNLGMKLVTALSLDKSPIVDGKCGAMCFRSIELAGGTASTDALDRFSSDDQTTEFLTSHGDDMPVLD